MLTLTITASGGVTHVVVKHSAGDTPEHKLLDQAAIDDIATCPITPARDGDGRPIETTTDITYTWQLM